MTHPMARYSPPPPSDRILIRDSRDPLYPLLSVGTHSKVLLPVLFALTPVLLQRYAVIRERSMPASSRPAELGYRTKHAKLIFWSTTAFMASGVW